MTTGTIAVFDVDETLISFKSMFSYLKFAYNHRYGADGAAKYAAAMDAINIARQTRSREDVNRDFYRLFAGWGIDELQAIASDWFHALDRQTLFIPEALSRYESHVEAGDTTVLLTGSASFIVAPIAQLLFADAVLSINLKILPDHTTSGEISGIQTIGQGKADALTAYVGANSAASIIGYGDHESDLPFLKLCDQAYVVTPSKRPFPDWAARAGFDRLDVDRPVPSLRLVQA